MRSMGPVAQLALVLRALAVSEFLIAIGCRYRWVVDIVTSTGLQMDLPSMLGAKAVL